MSADADRVWDLLAGKLRKQKGLCPPTPEEAERAYRKAPSVPLSRERMDEILKAAISGELPEKEPDDVVFNDDHVDKEVEADALALCRNEGDEPAAEQREKDLEDKLLSDDDADDEV
jgi:hypothetical protein